MAGRGRPFGTGKEKSVSDHFMAYGAAGMWSRGVRLFSENRGRSAIENGPHSVQLIEARFNGLNPVSNIFVFKLEDGSAFEKRIVLNTPEGIAALLFDLRTLGFNCTDWGFINDINKTLTERKPHVKIVAEMQGDIQFLHLKWAEIPMETKRVAPPQPPVIEVQEVIVVPAPPPPEPPIVQAPPPPPTDIAEVDIGPGDTIRARYQGQEVVGVILSEYPDDMEVLVRVGQDKVFIKAADIIAKL